MSEISPNCIVSVISRCISHRHLELLLLLLLLSHFSRVQLCVTPYTAAHQAPPSLGFSRQEHWSGFNAWKWKVKSLSRVRFFVIPWTAAYQAPPSTGFSRQEYWSGVPLPSPHLELDTSKTQSSATSPNEFTSTFPKSKNGISFI